MMSKRRRGGSFDLSATDNDHIVAVTEYPNKPRECEYRTGPQQRPFKIDTDTPTWKAIYKMHSCVVAHTSFVRNEVLVGIASGRRRGAQDVGGIMSRTVWGRSLSWSEIDRRSRQARLRLEQIERLFLWPGRPVGSRFRQRLYRRRSAPIAARDTKRG